MRLLYQFTCDDATGYCRQLSALLSPLVRPDVELVVDHIPGAPPSLEYGYQEALVLPGLIDAIRAAEDEFDGVIIGCFLDPGIHIAREVVSIPVVGLGQASLQLAATLGHKTGILAGLDRLVPAIDRMVHDYGYRDLVTAIEATELTVSEMRTSRAAAAVRVRDAIHGLVEHRHAEVVVGGCGSLGDLFADLRQEVGVPLVDPRVAAIKQLEMLVDLYRQGHAATSRAGLYATPPTHVLARLPATRR